MCASESMNGALAGPAVPEIIGRRKSSPRPKELLNDAKHGMARYGGN